MLIKLIVALHWPGPGDILKVLNNINFWPVLNLRVIIQSYQAGSFCLCDSIPRENWKTHYSIYDSWHRLTNRLECLVGSKLSFHNSRLLVLVLVLICKGCNLYKHATHSIIFSFLSRLSLVWIIVCSIHASLYLKVVSLYSGSYPQRLF